MWRAWEKVIRKGADSWFNTGTPRDRPLHIQKITVHTCMPCERVSGAIQYQPAQLKQDAAD